MIDAEWEMGMGKALRSAYKTLDAPLQQRYTPLRQYLGVLSARTVLVAGKAVVLRKRQVRSATLLVFILHLRSRVLYLIERRTANWVQWKFCSCSRCRVSKGMSCGTRRSALRRVHRLDKCILLTDSGIYYCLLL